LILRMLEFEEGPYRFINGIAIYVICFYIIKIENIGKKQGSNTGCRFIVNLRNFLSLAKKV
jgi:hypothetical protein